jgi:hypothetical protein
VNQHLIQAYLPHHDGRTRNTYIVAEDKWAALAKFRQQFPDRVPRNMWVLDNEAINTTMIVNGDAS